MDAQQHSAHIRAIQGWFGPRVGHMMSVTIHTGDASEYLATGPFLRLEAHPGAQGVYRALFDDSLSTSSGEEREKYFAFGSELIGVDTGPDRIILDKGAQRIEVADRTQSVPASDQVVWPAQQAATAPQQPPATIPQVAPAVPSQVPPTTAPQQQPTAGDAAYSKVTVKAPLYDNAMNGSRFVGTVHVSRRDGTLFVTGTRSENNGMLLVGGRLLTVLGALTLIGGLVIASGAESNSDMGAAFACMGSGLLMVLPGIVVSRIGRRRAEEGAISTLEIDLADARGRSVKYDTNLGCLVSLLLTPLVGLILVLTQGRRVVRMTVPNDRAGARRMNLVLKATSAADGARLAQMLRT